MDILFILEFTALHLHGNQNSTSDELTRHTIVNDDGNVQMFPATSSAMFAMTSKEHNDVPSRNFRDVSADVSNGVSVDIRQDIQNDITDNVHKHSCLI